MKASVEEAITGLRSMFPHATVTVEEDGDGGARVRVEPVELGEKYSPARTWMGGHIPPQCPYADVYPLFMGAEVLRSDGQTCPAPVSAGHTFMGLPALQISRRTNRLDPTLQTVAHKFQKVLHWLQHTL